LVAQSSVVELRTAVGDDEYFNKTFTTFGGRPFDRVPLIMEFGDLSEVKKATNAVIERCRIAWSAVGFSNENANDGDQVLDKRQMVLAIIVPENMHWHFGGGLRR